MPFTELVERAGSFFRLACEKDGAPHNFAPVLAKVTLR